MAKDKVGMYGKLKVRCFHEGENQPFYEGPWMDNNITDVGQAEVAQCIGNGLGGATFRYIGIGTGTNAESDSDTALQTEIETRADCSITNVTVTDTNDTAQFVGTVSITGSRAITEYGLFTASSDGVMLSREVQSAINLVSGDSIEITWKITFAT